MGAINSMFRQFGLFMLFTSAVAAAGKPVSGTVNPAAPPEIRVMSEVQPAGGTVQVKLVLTEPRPISTGTTFTSLDAGSFDSIYGVELFSATGDVFGTAVIQGTALQVNYVSPNATFGTSLDYPILTIAAHVRDDAAKGNITVLGGNLACTGWYGAQAYSFLIKPGTLTIGGTVSINDVTPGGGMWPAGTVVRVMGKGFVSNTSVKATARFSSVSVVSANEIDFVLAEATVLDGVRIDMKNPDGSADSYYSYLRGVKQGASAIPLLNTTLPIFSSLAYSQAAIAQASPGIQNSVVTALAIQNPGSGTAKLRLEAFSPFGISVATMQIALPSRGKLVRELGEYFGMSLPANSTVKASSDQPVQFLGIIADQAAGTASPSAVGR